MCSFSMAALALRVKNRVVADPSVGLSDIQDVIKKCLDGAGDYDLAKYLQAPPGLSWKTAACPVWLTKLQQLFTGLLKLAPNSCLAGKKVRGAIEKMCEPPSKVNFTKKSTADFVDHCDETIRVGMAHLRNLQGSELLRQRCFKKADADQIAVLQRMLAMIEVEDSQEVAAPANETPAALVPVPPVPPSWKQDSSSGMIPDTCQMPEPSVPTQAPINLIIDFESAAAVFNRIANKEQQVEPIESTPSVQLAARRPKAIAGTSPDGCLLQAGLSRVLPDMSVEDASILADLDEQKPINHGHKSQLARMNASYFDNPNAPKQGRGSSGRGGRGRGRGRGSKAGVSALIFSNLHSRAFALIFSNFYNSSSFVRLRCSLISVCIAGREERSEEQGSGLHEGPG